MSTIGGTEELAELLARTAQGDRAAFETLYTRTSSKLFGVALRICINRELAKEALQESFVSIWQKASFYDPAIASPVAWMARITRNQAIDLRRLKAERISDLADTELDDNVMSLAEDPELTVERYDALRRLNDCLSELPEDRKTMILLAYYNGWSREELAQKFARPVNTIKTALRRSLALLRECLDGAN